jgi:cysteine-rich repeat protein
VFVASHVPAGSGTRLTVSRLDATTGAAAWTQSLLATGNAGDEVTGLAVSGGTHVLVSGQVSDAPTAPDFAVIALAADTGAETWRVVLDGTATDATDADAARAIAVDGAGDVLAAGVLSGNATEDDLVVLKLDPVDGHTIWQRQVTGSQAGSEDVRDLAIDAQDDVVVAGRLRNLGSSGDLSAIKFSGATGAVRWQQGIDGTEHGSDTGFVIAVDPGGQVALAGRLRNGTTGDGYAVVRLSGATGGSFPCGNGAPDGGEACDDGNTTAGDGCRTDCTIEACGDGQRDPQEGCDDGNAVDDDCCSTACALAVDGTPCDDQDVCTTPDQCTDGACVGQAAVVCPPGDTCEISRCDSVFGGCILETLADGTRCDDGNQCTIADRCGAGACVGGPPPFCDDDDPCTTDACETVDGCVHPPVTGFDSVLCVFERRAIPFECQDPLPQPLARKLERTEVLLTLAAAEPDTGPARRLLKRAGQVARKAQRFATRSRDRGLLPFHCGQAIVDQMIFLRARVTELRAALA